MKNLLKLLMAGVLLTSVSCVQDITKDIAVGVQGGAAEFTVGIDASRVALGDKDAMGKYPLYWSDGDKISINGIASSALDIAEGEQISQANFTVTPGEGQLLEAPFSVLYPSNTAGQVVFKALQGYTEGTFATGTTPMYGYSEGSATLTLKHLAGALKIGIKGAEGTKVARVLVESTDGKPLSGTFDINCATGELTATEEVVVATAVRSTEGVELSPETPTFFYIALPAGEYTPLNVTIVTTDGKTMHVSAKDAVGVDNFTLAAGQVMAFNELTFAENAVAYEIWDVDGFFAFADMVKSGEFAKNYDKAVLCADIYAATGPKPWESIEDFNGIFDGQNFKIYDLAAPLFGKTCATIRNVVVAAPRISSDKDKIGAIAAHLTRKDPYAGNLYNCHTELDNGEGVVEYSGVATETSNIEIRLGGLVGQTDSSYCSIENCTNGVKVSFPETAVASSLLVGGIAGYNSATPLTNVKNFGTIDLKGTVKFGISTFDEETGEPVSNVTKYLVGGICGTGTVAVSGAENRGAINIAGEYVMTGAVYPTHGFAGCFGAKNSGVLTDNVHNYGPINVSITINDGDIAKNVPIYIGGVAAYAGSSQFTNCSNNATITVSGSHNYSSLAADNDGSKNFHGSALRIAGVVCRGPNNANYPYDNIVNNGNIICNVNIPKNAIHLGGVFNDAHQSAHTNVVNNGNITFGENAVCGMHTNIGGISSRQASAGLNGAVNNGNIEFKGTSLSLFAGGISGYTTVKTLNCTNTGCLTIAGKTSCTDGAYCWKIGGIVGGGSPAEGCTNGVENDATKGVINISTKDLVIANAWPDKDTAGTTFGGIISHATSGTVVNCKNYGAMTVTSDFLKLGGTSKTTVTIGGISGYCGGRVDDSENHGAINVSGNHSTTAGVTVAGICARNGNKQGTNRNLNTGAINVTATVKASLSISGGTCLYAAGNAVDCINNGPITVNATCEGTCYIGGIHSHDTSNKSDAFMSNCHNNAAGTITIAGGTYKELYIGGVSGYIGSSSTEKGVTNTSNKAAITIAKGATTTTLRIGGMLGRFLTKTNTNGLTDCANEGSITVDGTHGTIYFGGLLAQNGDKPMTITNCENKAAGDITFSGTASTVLYLGGICGYSTYTPATWTGIKNFGDINITGSCDVPTSTMIGGVVGNGAESGVLTGAISSSAISAPGYTFVGTIFGEQRIEKRYASQCQLGGSILRGDATEAVVLDATNYTQYVYGGDAAYVESDACTLYVPQTETPEQPEPETPAVPEA